MQPQERHERLEELRLQIQSAVDAGKFEGLAPLVDEFLKLQKDDAAMLKLHTQLAEQRRQKLDKVKQIQLAARERRRDQQALPFVDKARKFNQECRFDLAAEALSRIPTDLYTPTVLEFIAFVDRCAMLQKKAMDAIEKSSAEEFDTCERSANDYRTYLRRASLSDPTLESKLASKRHQTEQSMKTSRFRLRTTVAIIGITLITTIVFASVRMIVRLSKLPAQRAAAAKQAYEEIFAKPILKNSIGMELKLIPPGSFTMGTGGGVIQKGNPESPHIVEIRKAFYLGIYEVTQSQYEQVTGTNPSELVTGDHPVSNVTWTDAQKFCELLSGIAAEKAAKRSYRLPTEAEWEYACRSGTSSAFSFGKDELLIDDYAWYAGNSRGMNHPTGQKKPNAWGLFDMHGNVLEWCEDLFAEYPSAELVPAPKHRLDIRVLRGGSSNLESIKCRSAIRSAENPTLRSNFIGFRVAITIGT